MPDFGPPPSPQDLQFQHAEPIAEASCSEGSAPACAACKQPVGGTYYQAQGHVLCPLCAARIQAGQQAAPALSLMRAALYGGAAALAGCTLYALVAIVLHAEVGLIAILVGWMVGKAIRHASYGRGGRPQQILAVALTYFAITTSYIPVILYHASTNPRRVEQQRQRQAQTTEAPDGSDAPAEVRPRMSFGTTALFLLVLTAAAPFMALTSGVSAWISLFILFIGLQRAWKLTERREIQLMGPYPVEAPQ
jgi:hypothetical protein